MSCLSQVVQEVVREKTRVPIGEESGEVAAGASSEVTKTLKRNILEVGGPIDVPIDVGICAEETPRTLPKRKVGRPKKSVKEKIEESEAGRNWPDSEVYALIDIRGEMEPDFVKNSKKQGVDSWSNLHARMMASVEGFNRTPIACKRKFNSLYKQYKDDKMANNVSDGDHRNECKFHECLDHWWHFNGQVMKRASGSKNRTTPTMDNLKDDNGNQSGIGDEVNKSRKKEI